MEIYGPDPAKFALKSFTLRVLQWKVEHVKRLLMLNSSLWPNTALSNSSLWSNTAHDRISSYKKRYKTLNNFSESFYF